MIIALWYNWADDDSARRRQWWWEGAIKVKVAGRLSHNLTISNDLQPSFIWQEWECEWGNKPTSLKIFHFGAKFHRFSPTPQLIQYVPLASRRREKWAYSEGQEGQSCDLHQILDERSSSKARWERLCLCAFSPLSNVIFIFAWLNFIPPTQLPMLAPSSVSIFFKPSLSFLCFALTGSG